MPASLTSDYHGQTSGTNTSLAIASVIVAAGDRVLVDVAALSSSLALTSVTAGATPLTRIRSHQGHAWKRELWVWDVPTAGTYTITVTSPSAVKMGAAVYCIADAASFLTFLNVRVEWFDSPIGTPGTVFATPTSNTFSVASLALALIASDVSSQTFTVDSGTSQFEDDGVATTDVHLAAASDSIAAAGSQTYQITLGTADDWSASRIQVRSGLSPSTAVGEPAESNVTIGDASFSHTAETGKPIYLIVHAESLTLPTVTYGATPMVCQFHGTHALNDNHSLSVWSLTGAAAGADTITITSGGTVDSISFNIANGPSDGTIIAPDSNASQTGTTAKCNVGGWLTNSLCFGYTANEDGRAVTVTAGTSLVAESAGTGYKQGLAKASANGGLTPIAFSFTHSVEHAKLAFAIPSADEAVDGGSYQIGMRYLDEFATGLVLPHIYSRTIRNLRVDLTAAPGVGKSRAVTLRRNGRSTSMTVTISDAATSGTYTAADIEFRAYAETEFVISDTNTPATSQVLLTWEEELGQAGCSHYGAGRLRLLDGTVSTIRRINPITPIVSTSSGIPWGTTSQDNGLISADGTITTLWIPYQVELDSGDVYEFHIWLSRDLGTFVRQDGSGGTIDTKVTLTGSAQTLGAARGIARFSLPVEIGDRVYVTGVATADGGGLGLRAMAMIGFVANTNGQFMFQAHDDSLGTGSTTYLHPNGEAENATESTVRQTLGTLSTGLDVVGIVADINTAPGSGKSWTIKNRKNGADGSTTCSIADTATQAQGGGTTSYTTGDTIAVSSSPSGTPTASSHARIGLRGFMTPLADVEPEGFVVVTQLTGFIGYSEDAELDDPPEITDCTGGGTIAAGVNPTDGTSIATATALHMVATITVNGSLYEFSQTAINSTTAKKPRVDRYGRFRRALPDDNGGIELPSVWVELSDYDNLLRGWHESYTLQGLTMQFLVADETTWRTAPSNAQVRFSGVVRKFRPLQPKDDSSTAMYRFDVEDPLTLAFSDTAQETLLPPDLIDINDGTSDQGLREAPYPVMYGSLSDEDEDEPKGTVELPFIGTETVADHEEHGNLHKHLVCLSPTHKIHSIFRADPLSGDPPTMRSKAPDSEYGTDIFVPHQDGWLYPEQYSALGTKRVTVLYLNQAHPAANLARYNRIPLTANLCAREDVGDATGNVIDSPPRVAAHVLNTVWAQTVGDANWPSQSTRNGFSIIDTDSVEDVKMAMESAITGGFKWAFVLGHSFAQVTLRWVLEQCVTSADMEPFIGRFGQVKFAFLDRTSAAVGAPHDTAVFHIQKNSFSIEPHSLSTENITQYVYRRNYLKRLQQLDNPEGTRLPREPFDGDWLVGLQSVSNSASIAALGGTPRGEVRSQVQEMEFVREVATADAVAQRRNDLRSPANGRAEATYTIQLQRLDAAELGDLRKVTHPQGIGASGYVARRMQLRVIEEDWNNMTATITVRDVDDLLDEVAVSGLVLGDAPLTLNGDPIVIT